MDLLINPHPKLRSKNICIIASEEDSKWSMVYVTSRPDNRIWQVCAKCAAHQAFPLYTMLIFAHFYFFPKLTNMTV